MSAPTLDLFLPLVDPDIERLHVATALYTRDPVVDEVLERAGWPGPPGSTTRLLDPGAGDGQFTVAAAARLQTPADDTAALAARLQAWEIHPHACAAARRRLVRLLVHHGWRRSMAKEAAEAVVIEGDFITTGPDKPLYDIVAGNPPYLRFARLPESFKQTYTRAVPAWARGDLLHAFLDRAARTLRPGGRLVCITADRWLINETAGPLRERIGRRFGVACSTRLSSESAFYRPKCRERGTPPRVHPVLVALAPRTEAARTLTHAPFYPEGNPETPPGAVRLDAVAEVRIAPWLGPEGIFVLTREAARAADLPPETLVPCVDAKLIDSPDLRSTPLVAIRTSADTRPPRCVLAHLERTRHLLPERARREPFWLPPETWETLPYDHETLLIPRITKRLRSVRLSAGILPINHNITIVASPTTTDRIERALQIPASQAWFDVCAPRLEGGYRSITTNRLRGMPVVV